MEAVEEPYLHGKAGRSQLTDKLRPSRLLDYTDVTDLAQTLAAWKDLYNVNRAAALPCEILQEKMEP
jgi:hypothetical protein